MVAPLAVLTVLLGGCASTPPQASIPLAAKAAASGGGRVGVIMTPLPKVDTSLPGAGCLLCLAAASVANSGVTGFAQKLPYEDIPKLKGDIADMLRKKGANVVVIEEGVKIDALPTTGQKAPNVSSTDFASLRVKYNLDRLLVIDISFIGFERTYSAYVPTSDPKAVLRGRGYMVDLASNAYEWYLPINIVRSSQGNWDEPPKYPGLSNAYFQTLELGRDAFLQPFAP
jgi:hypothetical protein